MIVKRVIRSLLESTLDQYGYVLKDKDSAPLGLDGFVAALAANGFSPATVIDVGVGNGTPWLYNGFSKARFELFEPLDTFVPSMEKICKSINAGYHVTALGAKAGLAEIDVNLDIPTGSTMSGHSAAHSPAERSGRTVRIERRSIPVRCLDEFGPFEAPILLKLDVEGFEMDVLHGAKNALARTEVIISEVSVTKRHEKDVSPGTFISYVESLGFSLIDIAELIPRRRNGPLCYIDAAFARTGGALCR